MSSPVNPNANNIFAFWESPNPIPAYLDLCKDTWIKNIPNCEIHILNHDNLDRYLEGVYDLQKLKTISFAMQSDIVSAAVLEKFGGLFLDLDCIVIDDVFRIFNEISTTKLISFGRSEANAIHLAVLYSKQPNNPILTEWRKGAQARLNNKPEKYGWDYFGNAIINPLLTRKQYRNKFHILDRTFSGNILESTAVIDASLANAIADYKNFYFNKYFQLSPKVLELVRCGVISLHNSWTPSQYKAMSKKEDFFQQDIPLVSLLKHILNHETRSDSKNSILMVEAQLANQLDDAKIWYKLRYLNEMLVIDFDINGSQFAFDVVYTKEGGVQTYLVLRNFGREFLEGNQLFIGNNWKFVNNKCSLNLYSDLASAGQDMIKIYGIIEKFANREFLDNLVGDVYLDLEKLEVKQDLLFIEGVAFVKDKSAPNYSDIDYQLLFVENGVVRYKKRLAKPHRPDITARFSTNTQTNYDKCGFTTPQFKGIDIADIAAGKYELQLYINVAKTPRIQVMRSIKALNFSGDSVAFECNKEGNQFTVFQNKIVQTTQYTNQKIQITGDYFDSNNNRIIAPSGLSNCFIQFLGSDSEVIIDTNANLKNTTIEMRNNGRVVIGEKVGFFGNIRVGYGSSMSIGSRTTSTNPVYVTIAESTSVTIGEDCMFATNNQIRTDDAHPIYDLDTGNRINHSKDIWLGDHVWVGYGATLFGGSKIGNGSVVGAFSVVRKQFPDNCIVAGVPAKIIRQNIFWERPLLLNMKMDDHDLNLQDGISSKATQDKEMKQSSREKKEGG